jgi:hypothetical protein
LERKILQVIDLVRPHTQEQIALLAFTALPSLGANLRVLKITGNHDVDVFQPSNFEFITLPRVVLQQIKDSCTGLRTFAISKCRFDLQPGFQEDLPGTLETLEFNACWYRNLYNFSSSFRIMSNYHTASCPFQMYFIYFPILCRNSGYRGRLAIRGRSWKTWPR